MRRLRNNIAPAALTLGLAAGLILAPHAALAKKHAPKPVPSENVTVDLPAGDDFFPDRPNAEAVDRNCLSCHSTEMVTNQPALPRMVWAAEISRMRTQFDAQISPDDDDAILAYLTAINGTRRDKWR